MKTVTAELTNVEVKSKGTPGRVSALRVDGKTFLITGKLLKTASLKNEWQEDVDRPEMVIAALKKSPVRIDLFRFWQRLPETEAKYPYYKEWRQIAAIPITTFAYWWEKQIRFRSRNKMRKAQKLGVTIREASLDDAFVHGVMSIYNQSPVRRGKPFRHYGKSFSTVKAELSIDLEEAVFVAAYYEEEMIGFVKFQVDDRYARITLILDKVIHRDKSPVNGMIAKVVEICAQRRISYLTYYLWRRGDHGKFQESVGFEKFAVPEYYVALSWLGRLSLRLGVHREPSYTLPESVIVPALAVRSKWYEIRHPQHVRPRRVVRAAPAETQSIAAEQGIRKFDTFR